MRTETAEAENVATSEACQSSEACQASCVIHDSVMREHNGQLDKGNSLN